MDVARALKGNSYLTFLISAGDITDDHHLAQSSCPNPIVLLLSHCRIQLKAEPRWEKLRESWDQIFMEDVTHVKVSVLHFPAY